MSSFTLSLSGTSSDLSASYHPPIELGLGEYACGLIDFTTYMSIANISERNNTFCFKNEETLDYKVDPTISLVQSLSEIDIDFANRYNYNSVEIEVIDSDNYQETTYITIKVVSHKYIKLEPGSYEISDIFRLLELKIAQNHPGVSFESDIEKTTQKCMLKMNREICFDCPNSMASILGFGFVLYPKNVYNYSDKLVNVNPISIIRVETNITSGSYANNSMNRGIYEFYPSVGVGYKIMERPKTVIYLPVSERSISNFRVRIVDQEENLVDFRGEQISLRVHIKKI